MSPRAVPGGRCRGPRTTCRRRAGRRRCWRRSSASSPRGEPLLDRRWSWSARRTCGCRLNAKLVQASPSRQTASVAEGDVPVVAVELLAVGGVVSAADAEVLLPVALVDDLQRSCRRVPDLVVEARHAQGLVERWDSPSRRSTKAPPGRNRVDVVLVDVLDGQEVVGACPRLMGPPSVKPDLVRACSRRSTARARPWRAGRASR